MSDKDTEVLDRLEDVFRNSLNKDIPKKRKEFNGSFAEGYIESMTVTAEWVLEFLKKNREK